MLKLWYYAAWIRCWLYFWWNSLSSFTINYTFSPNCVMFLIGRVISYLEIFTMLGKKTGAIRVKVIHNKLDSLNRFEWLIFHIFADLLALMNRIHGFYNEFVDRKLCINWNFWTPYLLIYNQEGAAVCWFDWARSMLIQIFDWPGHLLAKKLSIEKWWI